MSYSVDVNILVHASNETSPNHEAATRFMSGRTKDPDVFCLAWVTIMGYLRIATHPSIFPVPLRPDSALANITALLALPRVRVVTEGEDYRAFLDVYRTSSGIPGVRGNLVPDAHLAAILQANGVQRLYTADADFLRFNFIEVRNPFSG